MSDVKLASITQVTIADQNGLGIGASASFGPALKFGGSPATKIGTQFYTATGVHSVTCDEEDGDICHGEYVLEMGHKIVTWEKRYREGGVRLSPLWGYRWSRLNEDSFTKGIEIAAFVEHGFTWNLLVSSPDKINNILVQVGVGYSF
ncbi:MAG: hypothetical protein HY539_05245 [Deltaproteobacteria bacterium]|nr:hypothetical protein [Deltaproteobacteria bacterium]